MHFEPFSLFAIISAVLAFGALAYLIESTERHYAKRLREIQRASDNATRICVERATQ
jgi:Flp pilus assembly protein TadB